MTLLALVAVVALLPGLAVWAAMARWPTADPGAPKVEASKVRRHPRLAALARRRLDPAATTGLLLTAAIVVLALGVVATGVLLLMVRRHAGFASFDGSAARFGARHAGQVSTTVLRWLTQLGGAVVLGPLSLLVVVAERRRRPLVVLIFLTLAVGGQFLLANTVKALVTRARPDLLHLTGFSGSSFPSGHATAAAASFAAFALVLGRGRSLRSRRLLAAWAVGLAVAVAATRVLLGVHWLTDVLAGLALGWAWFALCSIAFGGRVLRFAQPVVRAQQAVGAR
ncbi:MAG: phosphatase PAP2 family protein [Actinomycetota bacterium]|nr:phosphatase PAP2 family protein [Actinomycetota bacterium]